MPSINSIRFSKYDKFNNIIFITKPDEKENFEKLTKNYNKLRLKNYNTFLPIYASSGYASIRFKKNDKITNLQNRACYDLEYTIKKKDFQKFGEDKSYVSCYLTKCRQVTKAEPIEMGEDLDLSD